MAELKLTITKAVVVLTNNTDQIMLYTDKPPPFPPEFSKEPLALFFNTPYNTGVNYCQDHLGLEEIIIKDARVIK